MSEPIRLAIEADGIRVRVSVPVRPDGASAHDLADIVSFAVDAWRAAVLTDPRVVPDERVVSDARGLAPTPRHEKHPESPDPRALHGDRA